MKPRTRNVLRIALAIFMVLAGINHFLSPDFYVALMPPQLPAPEFLVFLSGGVEAGLGAMLLVPNLSRLAAWGIIATLIAVYPANIYHAVSGGLDDPALPSVMNNAAVAWLRLPFQFLFIWWAWLCTKHPAASDQTSSAD